MKNDWYDKRVKKNNSYLKRRIKVNLVEMIDERLIQFHLNVKDKEDAIKQVGNLMYQAGKVSDANEYIKGVFEREKEFATGIGFGIAIPHCQADCVKSAAFTLVKLDQAIEWGSLDNQPVNYIIMLAAPNSADNVHLKMLSTLAMNLMDEDFRSGLLNASSVEEIKQIFISKGE